MSKVHDSGSESQESGAARGFGQMTTNSGSRLDQLLIIRAGMLFDGAGGEHDEGSSVWIRGNRIIGVYGQESPAPPRDAHVVEFPDGCLLPGLIDTHVHLMYGTADRRSGARSYHQVNEADSAAAKLCVRMTAGLGIRGAGGETISGRLTS